MTRWLTTPWGWRSVPHVRRRSVRRHTVCDTPGAAFPFDGRSVRLHNVCDAPPLRGRRSDPHVRRRGVPRRGVPLRSVQRHGVRSPHAEVATLLKAASPLNHTAESSVASTTKTSPTAPTSTRSSTTSWGWRSVPHIQRRSVRRHTVCDPPARARRCVPHIRRRSV